MKEYFLYVDIFRLLEDSFTIYFEQTGGFAGMSIRVVLDDQLLSKDENEQVHILIEQADFFQLETDEDGNPLPDQLLYRISVETPSRKHTVSVYERNVTPGLQPLIRFLRRKAARRK